MQFKTIPEVNFMEIVNFFVLIATDCNHLGDDQGKAPTLQDFKLITTPSAHSPLVASKPKVRFCDA